MKVSVLSHVFDYLLFEQSTLGIGCRVINNAFRLYCVSLQALFYMSRVWRLAYGAARCAQPGTRTSQGASLFIFLTP